MISDSVIALAYFAIPAALLWFIRKRPDLPFTPIFALFGVFIIACGPSRSTSWEVWNLWHADYCLAGAIKAPTAAASCPAPLSPPFACFPGPSTCSSISTRGTVHRHTEKEIQDRRELRETRAARQRITYREQAELLDLTHDAHFRPRPR